MNHSLFEMAKAFLKAQHKKKIWYRVLYSMAVLVIFVTTYMLILPAITMERPAVCGMEEHVHTEDCYEQAGSEAVRTLGCGIISENPVIHIHDTNCYDENGSLVCQLSEIKAHVHTDACYSSGRHLVCGLEESAEGFSAESADVFSDGTDIFSDGEVHTHTEECYQEEVFLNCGQQEVIPHTHGEECYDGEGNLVCTLPEIMEHQHTEECFIETENASEPALTCGKEEHVHTEACYPVEEPTPTPEPTIVPDKEITETPAPMPEAVPSPEVSEKPEESENIDETVPSPEVSEEPEESGSIDETVPSPEVSEEPEESENIDEAVPVSEVSEEPEESGNIDEAVPSPEVSEEPEESGSIDEAVPTPEVSEEPEESENIDEVVPTPEVSEEPEEEESIGEVTPTPEAGEESAEDDETAPSPEVSEAPAEGEEETSIPEAAEIPAEDNEDEISLICGQEEHIHTEVCYNENDELICELEEHEHTLDCLPEEDRLEFTTMLMELTGEVLDFKPYITSLITKKMVGGRWVSASEFTDGDSIQLRLNYTIPANTVPGNSISYTFPQGMSISKSELEEIQDIPVTQNGITVGHAKVVEEAGEYKVVITFNTGDGIPGNEAAFEPQESFSGNFTLEATVSSGDDGTDRVIDFGGDGGQITIKHKETGSETENGTDLNINKEGAVATLNADGTVTVHYTVIAYTTNGSDGPVTITDKLALNKITGSYDEDSFVLKKITASGEEEDVDTVRKEIEEEEDIWNKKITIGFMYSDLPELDKGESYVLTYSATVKIMENCEEDPIMGLWNDVSAGDKTNNKTDNSWIVPVTKLTKTGGLYQNENKITWTINVSNAANLSLRDVLGDTIKDIAMTNIHIEGGTLNESLSQEQLESGYVLPSNDEYRITYDTDVSDLPEGTVAKNTVKVGSKEQSAEVTVRHADWEHDKKATGLTDTTDSAGEISGTQIHWEVGITLPDKEWEKETYFDVVKDAVCDGVSYEGSHYGMIGTINANLKKSLSDDTSKVSYTIEYYTDETGQTLAATYDETGSDVVYQDGYDKDTKIKSFKIMFSPSESVTDTRTLRGQQIKFNYTTNADYKGITQAGEYKFVNQGTLNDVTHEGYYIYTKVDTVEPSLSKQGGVLSDTTVNYDSGTTTTVNYVRNGNKLYYRLVVSYDPNATSESTKQKDLVIKDELPAGASYGDEVDIKLHPKWDTEGSKEEAIWYDCTPKVTKGSNDETKGKTLTITCPGGKWFNEGYNAFIVYYTVTVDDWNGTDAEIKNKASVNEEPPVEHTTNVVNDKELVTKSGVQCDINGHEIVLNENGNIIGYIDENGAFVQDSQVTPSNRVKYTVEINPEGKTLNDGSELTLTDSLFTEYDMGASLDAGSIVLYYYSEDEEGHKGAEVDTSFYHVSHQKNDSGQYVMTIRVPDSTAFILEYNYSFDLEDIETPTVSNSVSLLGETSSVDNWTLKKVAAGATVDQAHVTITKVDEDDIAKTLSQAKFRVEYFKVYDIEYNEEKGINEAVMLPEGEDGEWVTLENEAVTGVHGTLEFDSIIAEGNTMTLYNGCIYRLTEVAPPPGYAGTEKVYYFAVRSGTIPGLSGNDQIYNFAVKKGLNESLIKQTDIEFFGTTGGTALFTNKANSIAVRKIWQDYNGYEIDGTPVKVQLYQQTYIKQSYTVKVINDYLSKSIKNVSAGGSVTIWCYGAPNGAEPIVVDDTNQKYVSYRQDDWGWGVQYYYSIENISKDLEVTITGAYNNSDSDFDIKLNGSSDPGFTPYGEAKAVGAPVTLDNDNGWHYLWENLDITNKDGTEKYYYTVKEVDETGNVYTVGDVKYDVIYNNNNGILTGEIAVVNRCRTQYVGLTVKKVWKDSSGKDITTPNFQEVSFTLYQDENPLGTYTLGSSNFTAGEDCKYNQVSVSGNWQGIIRNLPAGHKYSVQETKIDGYTVENGALELLVDDEGNLTGYCITITNTSETTYTLPETGGPGTKLYTLGGLLLSVLAVLLMYKQQKQRREVN